MKQFSLAICAAIFLSACGGSSSVASSTTSGTSGATNGAGVTNASAVFNLPGTPTNVTGIAGDGSVTLNFMAPASDGGATIASYTATCMAGSVSRTISTTSSPVVVTGLLNGTKYRCNVAAVNAAGVGAVSASVELTPVVATAIAIDPSKVPLGDGKFSQTGPAVGYVYTCYSANGGGGASSKGPWFNSDGLTWNSLSKISVQGAVNWTSSFLVSFGSTLGITGNGLPPNPTGTFPIASTDPAYAYDRNPNAIAQANIAWGLPAHPVVADKPRCTGLGAIGVLLDGVRLFNADDGANRDAVAWEIQDACQGHPERTGKYHHHNVSSCLTQKDTPGQHSPLVGYIADGFGLYGNLGENGKALTNADLDECHGHTHMIVVNGVAVNQYHYHQTKEFPYTIGCYKGTPVSIN
ncbi:MAG: YHYH protein [Burkholderiales bacterium]|nr:YHYH protein [Burkholderiales bacterium]